MGAASSIENSWDLTALPKAEEYTYPRFCGTLKPASREKKIL
jgi:hypothetical protein